MNDLFTYADAHTRARKSDPDTAKLAAERTPSELRHDYQRVLACHRAHANTGLTDFELAAMLRGQQTSLGKRRGELRDMGLIEDSGTRRPSPSGSMAIVWRLTEAGREGNGA